MTMLFVKGDYSQEKSKEALAMLLVDRKNEFRELANVIFRDVPASRGPIKDWEEFVLNFCLDLNTAFKSWSGQEQLVSNSDRKALIILRQLSNNKSMNAMTHLLNIAYTLAQEFETIYKRVA